MPLPLRADRLPEHRAEPPFWRPPVPAALQSAACQIRVFCGSSPGGTSGHLPALNTFLGAPYRSAPRMCPHSPGERGQLAAAAGVGVMWAARLLALAKRTALAHSVQMAKSRNAGTVVALMKPAFTASAAAVTAAP